MIVLILLFGFILRLINLNQSLWLDEAITALAVKNSTFIQLVTKFSPGDFHPPLYYLFLKLWSNIFGYSEISLRFPSVIFGVLTIYIVYLIGRKISNAKIGLIAAVFIAVNPLAVYYSQEARMYSTAMMLVTASVLFLLHKKRLLFVFSLALTLYTDYMPYLMLPVLFMYSSATILSCLLLLPWTPFLFNQLTAGASVSNSWGDTLGRTNMKNLLLVPVKFIFGRISVDNKILYAVITVPILAIYSYFLSRSREKILWFWLLAPLLLGAVISFKLPIFSYFRFLFVLPPFLLLLAKGAQNSNFFKVLIISVSVISLAMFNLYPRYQRENWREAAKYMQNARGNIIMPSLAQAAPLNYYYPKASVEDREALPALVEYRNIYTKNLYLVRYVQEIFDPEDEERKLIESASFIKTEEKNFNGVIVWKYERINSR